MVLANIWPDLNHLKKKHVRGRNILNWRVTCLQIKYPTLDQAEQMRMWARGTPRNSKYVASRVGFIFLPFCDRSWGFRHFGLIYGLLAINFNIGKNNSINHGLSGQHVRKSHSTPKPVRRDWLYSPGFCSSQVRAVGKHETMLIHVL